MSEISGRTESEQRREGLQTAPANAERKTTKTKAAPTVDFADGMLENAHLKHPRRSIDILISLAGQTLFVTVLILIPLLYTQAFDVRNYEQTFLAVPPPPPPPPPKAIERVVVRPKASLFDNGKLVAPKAVPKHVVILKEAPEESTDAGGVAGGVVGGVAGGTLGGALGGVLGPGSTPVPPPPSKPVRSSGPLRVGGRVQAPRLIRRVQPVYPILAKSTRTQGSVVLDCIIDQQGNVTQIRLISGHPLLVQAALDAVRQWKYQPTLLNGQPVAVEMQVTVNFTMGD